MHNGMLYKYCSRLYYCQKYCLVEPDTARFDRMQQKGEAFSSFMRVSLSVGEGRTNRGYVNSILIEEAPLLARCGMLRCCWECALNVVPSTDALKGQNQT